MKAKKSSWWQQIRETLSIVWDKILWPQIKKHPYATGVIVFLVLMLFIFSAYRFGWDWSGFNSETSQINITSTSKVNYTATVSQLSKSLWDWLQLLAALAIPIVVGFGAVWFTTRQGKVADAENKDNQRETALQSYIDKISELLLHEKLNESPPPNEVQVIARARTATVLRILDPIRRGSLIRFLSQAGILTQCIEDELYEIDLQGANLARLKLVKINLAYANLRRANLLGAHLQDANLLGAHLQDAILIGADLQGAILIGADLKEAFLKNNNLEKANLFGTDITQYQLEGAKSLKGATMPDGSIHP